MNKRFKTIISILTFLSFVSMFLNLRNLPDQIPIHFDFKGNPDGYGSKYTYLFLTLLPLLMVVLADVLPQIDPKKENYKYQSKAFYITIGFTCLLFLALPWVIVLGVLNNAINTTKLVFTLIGLLLIVIGNFTPTFKQTYFVGIRTPWTLADEDVWRKTHRYGGFVFVLDGIIMILTGIVENETLIIAGTAFMIISLLSILGYSYLVFKTKQK